MARKSRRANIVQEKKEELHISTSIITRRQLATAAYARLSVDKEKNDESIQNQIELLHQYIREHKRYKKKIFQEIYYCKKYGPSNHLKHVGCDKRFYKEHMYGKAYFVHMIEPDIGKEILRQLDEIRWEE